MPQSRLPMPSEKNPHEALSKRLQIVDLLSGVFLTGAIVACISDQSVRVICFVVLAALSVASVWWGASIANTYQIRNAGVRVLIHAYSLLGFICFLALIPLVITIFIAVASSWKHKFNVVISLLLSVAVNASMFVVERKRIAAEARKELTTSIPTALPAAHPEK